MSEEDNLFSRWSRRKRRVAEEEFVPTPSEKDEAALVEQEPETPEEEAALLERLNLPLPESLKSGDDFSAFMRAGVPEFLRKRALRVLWKSNPVLANLDGLNDYDDDYLTGSYGNAPIKTGYQVGKGMMSHLLEMQRQAEAAEDPAEVPQPEEVDTTDDVPELIAQDAAEDPHVVAQDDGAEAEVTYTPRRMQFTFDEERA